MRETIYNLFAYVHDDIITKVGIAPHSVALRDSEKEAFLKKKAESDLRKAAVYSVYENFRMWDLDTNEDFPGLPYAAYKNMVKKNECIAVYEGAFQAVRAPERPFVNYSIVQGGRIVERHE